MLDVEPVVEAAPEQRGATRRFARALAALLLGGLTSMEVLALSIGFVATMGVLWATHTVAPERLITEPAQRVGWILAVVAVLRPVTWIPYLMVFVGLRRLGDLVGPGSRPWVRNLTAHLLTVGLLVGAVALIFLAVPGSARWTASALGFSRIRT